LHSPRINWDDREGEGKGKEKERKEEKRREEEIWWRTSFLSVNLDFFILFRAKTSPVSIFRVK